MGPVTAYKFVPQDVIPPRAKTIADMFESGESIQVGSFSYYAERESARTDELEGRYGYHIDRLTFGGADLASGGQKKQSLEAFGFGFESGVNLVGNIIIEDCSATWQAPESYIFCAAQSPDAGRGEGCALFAIRDLHMFARLLSRAAGAALPDQFHIAPVRYDKRLIDPQVEKPSFSPFVKPPSFSDEDEIRVCWKPMSEGPVPTPVLRINAPEVASLIERIR